MMYVTYTIQIFVMGCLSIGMGFIAMALAMEAKRQLSKGIINKYLSYYITSIFLIVTFCILYTIRKLYGLHTLVFETVEYYLLTASFFSLVLVSYRTLHIGKTFGFKNVGFKFDEKKK